MSDTKIDLKKPIAYLILSLFFFIIVGSIASLLLNINWISNHPVGFFLFYLFISALLTLLLYLMRPSYKYANDIVLAISAGLYSLEFITTGEKDFQALPTLELMSEHPLQFYIKSFFLVVVANSLIAKVFINIIDFIRSWIKEEEDYKDIKLCDRIRSVFKKPFIKEERKKKN